MIDEDIRLIIFVSVICCLIMVANIFFFNVIYPSINEKDTRGTCLSQLQVIDAIGEICTKESPINITSKTAITQLYKNEDGTCTIKSNR